MTFRIGNPGSPDGVFEHVVPAPAPLVLREVQPEARDSSCTPGRPLYWRLDSAGYTHEVEEAGLYPAGRWKTVEHSREVDAVPAIDAALDQLAVEEAAIVDRRSTLLVMLDRVRGAAP